MIHVTVFFTFLNATLMGGTLFSHNSVRAIEVAVDAAHSVVHTEQS